MSWPRFIAIWVLLGVDIAAHVFVDRTLNVVEWFVLFFLIPLPDSTRNKTLGDIFGYADDGVTVPKRQSYSTRP